VSIVDDLYEELNTNMSIQLFLKSIRSFDLSCLSPCKTCRNHLCDRSSLSYMAHSSRIALLTVRTKSSNSTLILSCELLSFVSVVTVCFACHCMIPQRSRNGISYHFSVCTRACSSQTSYVLHNAHCPHRITMNKRKASPCLDYFCL